MDTKHKFSNKTSTSSHKMFWCNTEAQTVNLRRSEALCSMVAALMADMGSGLVVSWESIFWATMFVNLGHDKSDSIACSCEVDGRGFPKDEKKMCII